MTSLDRTYVVLPGQNYALISLVGPDEPQRHEHLALKIYSMHASIDDAKKHAARLQKEDATFNIYVVETCTWGLIPPPRDLEIEKHYVDEKLEEIMTKFHENKRMAAAMFEKRKRDMMAKPIEGSETPYIDPSDENSKFYNKPDVPPIPHPSDFLPALREEFPDRDEADLAHLASLKVLDIIAERRQASSSGSSSSSSSSSMNESKSEPSSDPSSDKTSSSSEPPSSVSYSSEA
jgi:Family of unknown function (DUF5832)